MLVSYDMALLVIVSWREARGDGREAMRAVAHVIANRVKANKSSWVVEICKPNQFSSMTICGDGQTIVWPSEKDAISVYAMLHNVYDGTDPDNTNGAIFYANLETATSGWFFENIVQRPDLHPKVALIGKQTFFK